MIRVSNHAVDRYQERVKPALSIGIARQELEVLVQAAGEPTDVKPDWHRKAEPDCRYLPLCDGIAALVKGEVVTSVLARCGESPEVKEAKRAEKKKRREERRADRRTLYRSGRPERRGISWE